MKQIYNNIDDFIINRCKVVATIKKCWEIVDYELIFELTKTVKKQKKLNWEIISPIKGFEFKRAFDLHNKIEIFPEINNKSNGLVKVKIPLENSIFEQDKSYFSINYENKIDSEIISENYFSKTFGFIITRSFGSKCLEYNLQLKIENNYYRIKHVTPRFDFKEDKIICFNDIPTQKPVSVSIIVSRKIEKTLLVMGFILSSIGGYYIPEWFKKIIDLLKI